MKKLINNILRVALVILVFGLSSCQEEFEVIGDDSQRQRL